MRIPPYTPRPYPDSNILSQRIAPVSHSHRWGRKTPIAMNKQGRSKLHYFLSDRTARGRCFTRQSYAE